MNQHLSTTLTVFYFILIVFVIIPITYWALPKKRLNRLENKSLFLDIRFWIPSLVYAFLLGYRWDYAYDWEQYYNTFNYIQSGLLYRDSTEKGYLFINYLLGQCGFDFYSIFILEGFVYILSIYVLIKHNRLAVVFSLPLLYMAFRYNGLNISRQAFAQSILWIGFYFLMNRKKKWYFILGAIACSIHSSAYVWIVIFYLVRYLKFPSIKVSLLFYSVSWSLSTVIQTVLVMFSTLLTTYIIVNKGYDSSHMMNERFIREQNSIFQLLVYGTIHIGYILTSYFVINKIKTISKYEKLLVLIGIIGICANIIGRSHEIIDRFFWYFSNIYYISWGILLVYLIKNRSKVPWYIWLFNILGILQMLWSMYANIIREVTSIMHHYLEYRVNFF